MGYYGTGWKYGSGILYGATSVINSISPDSGPSTGGVAFYTDVEGADPRIWDDLFLNPAVPDPLLWATLPDPGGSATLTTGTSHLQLSTGAVATSVAGIESLQTWTDCQCEIRVMLPQLAANPGGNVIPIALQLYVDANNYGLMYVQIDATGAYTINCDIYRGGASIATYSTTTTHGVGLLKILRFGTTLYFYYNNTLIYTNKDFVATVATYRVYSTNLAQNTTVLSTVIWFYWRTFVAFGEQVVHNPTVVSDFRLRGLTPPSLDSFYQEAAYAGLVDFTLVGATSVTSVSAYEYYYLDRLKVMNNEQNDTLLSVIDDDRALTKTGYKKGL